MAAVTFTGLVNQILNDPRTDNGRVQSLQSSIWFQRLIFRAGNKMTREAFIRRNDLDGSDVHFMDGVEGGDSTVPEDESFIGKMFFYFYDPIGREKGTIRYFDRFPLIIPYSVDSKGWMAINLHYLDYYSRAVLFDRLYNALATNKNNPLSEDNTIDAGSWDELKGASGDASKYIYPCIKRYRADRIRSKMIYVSPKEWQVALMLPFEDFAGPRGGKMSKTFVWKDSYRRSNR